MIKKCSKHGLTEYVVEKDNHKRCKKCRSLHVMEHRRRKKQRLVDYFGGRCVICGYKKYVGALQFHHLDPKKKKFELSVHGLSHGWENVLSEAKKCILVCGNCHCEIEFGIINISSVAQR